MEGEHKDDIFERCLKELSELSPKWQRTFAWFINNYEFAVKICEASKLTKSEIEILRQKAIESKDTVLELLLILKSVLESADNNDE